MREEYLNQFKNYLKDIKKNQERFDTGQLNQAITTGYSHKLNGGSQPSLTPEQRANYGKELIRKKIESFDNKKKLATLERTTKGDKLFVFSKKGLQAINKTLQKIIIKLTSGEEPYKIANLYREVVNNIEIYGAKLSKEYLLQILDKLNEISGLLDNYQNQITTGLHRTDDKEEMKKRVESTINFNESFKLIATYLIPEILKNVNENPKVRELKLEEAIDNFEHTNIQEKVNHILEKYYGIHTFRYGVERTPAEKQIVESGKIYRGNVRQTEAKRRKENLMMESEDKEEKYMRHPSLAHYDYPEAHNPTEVVKIGDFKRIRHLDDILATVFNLSEGKKTFYKVGQLLKKVKSVKLNRKLADELNEIYYDSIENGKMPNFEKGQVFTNAEYFTPEESAEFNRLGSLEMQVLHNLPEREPENVLERLSLGEKVANEELYAEGLELIREYDSLDKYKLYSATLEDLINEFKINAQTKTQVTKYIKKLRADFFRRSQQLQKIEEDEELALEAREAKKEEGIPLVNPEEFEQVERETLAREKYRLLIENLNAKREQKEREIEELRRKQAGEQEELGRGRPKKFTRKYKKVLYR